MNPHFKHELLLGTDRCDSYQVYFELNQSEKIMKKSILTIHSSVKNNNSHKLLNL